MTPIPGIIASSQTGGLVTSSFESIATLAGSGTSSTISFTSIPSGYKALQLRYIAKSTQNSSSLYDYTITFNGSTSSYAYHNLTGDGTTAAATGNATKAGILTNKACIPGGSTGLANMHGVGIIDIIDYTSTSKNKTLRGFAGVDTNGTVANCPMVLFSGLWYATPAAITSIDLVLATGKWETTSSFALYGIK